MLMRRDDGDEEPWRGLRRSIVTLCDMRHLARQGEIIRATAKAHGRAVALAIAAWEQLGCPDVTQADGLRALEDELMRL